MTIEAVEADVEYNNASGEHQFRWQTAFKRIMGQVEALEASKIAEGWRDEPSETSGSHQDVRDRAVAAAEDAIPLAAVRAVHPRHVETAAATRCEPAQEAEEGAPLLLRAGAGRGGEGEQEGSDKANEREGRFGGVSAAATA